MLDKITWVKELSKQPLKQGYSQRVCRITIPDKEWKDAVTKSSSVLEDFYKSGRISDEVTKENMTELATMIAHYCILRGSSDNCSINMI